MATEAMAPEMLSYLDSCSEDMASQIIGALQQAGRRAAPNAAASMTVTGSAVTKIEKKQRQKAKPAPATGGPKRPLNSWMAYRKYYNRVLEGSTQKAISKCLTQLWKADLFTAKWALLAKAYSIVRGCGEKKDAPLDAFFAICAPLIGIIPPESYLQAMGWQLSPPQEGDQERIPQLTRFFEPTSVSLERDWPLAATTNFGVDDLVHLCYAKGYGKPSDNGSQNASSHGSVTMASRPTTILTNDMGATTHMTPVAQPDTTPVFNEAMPDSSMDEEQQLQMLLDAASPYPAMNLDGPSPLTHDSAINQELFDNSPFTEAQMEHALSVTEDETFPFVGAQVDLTFDNVVGPEADQWNAFNTFSAQYVDFSGGQCSYCCR